MESVSHFTTPTDKNKLLLEKALQLKANFVVGVVNPISAESLKGALLAAEKGLITPILIGPIDKITATAENIGKKIEKYECIAAKNDIAAAKYAVEFARDGKVQALMKGDIHTDELMKIVLAREAGLRTLRRISHCLVMDIPTYEKLAIFTDVAINIASDLKTKQDIVQNAIDFAHKLDIKKPQVALLAAIETVMESIPATLDAAVLCKMADRGQITGGILDGPLSIDLAVSKEAMELKHFKPILADKPDIFVAPDLNSGNIAIKVLDYMANAQSAGIVVGAKVPIILMRRSSPAVEYIISCALAKLYVQEIKS